MKVITNLFTGLLLSGIVALDPDTSLARGGGGGGHIGGFHGGFERDGIGAVRQGFHGSIAQRVHGNGAWHHDGGWRHHSYPAYYGSFGPFAYGLDDYANPNDDNNGSFDAAQATNDVAPYESRSQIMSVQKDLSRLGYYHGPIDGVAGSETSQAIRWFQSTDHLPVTGQIDNATLQALGMA